MGYGRTSALAAGVLLALLSSGCATRHQPYPVTGARFKFPDDTFSYANELVWEYQYDAKGKWTTKRREPKPQYSLHCYVLARSARQFFQNARFDAAQPVADQETYRRLIRRVVSSSPRKRRPEAEKVAIPGYPNLRAFSQAHEALLKQECGSAWESYCQRGNWRMIFPFSRRHQQKAAAHLLQDLCGTYPVVVHVGRFPQLTINHALVIYSVEEKEREVRFITYDPNYPEKPGCLIYDRPSRTFMLPANKYFEGGRVDVYELYCSWNY